MHSTARGLRAFLARDGTDHDWAGALLVAEFLGDVRFIRSFVEAYAKALKKASKKGKR